MIDLLELGDISWAAYQENMPSDGFTGMKYVGCRLQVSLVPYHVYASFASKNYLSPGAAPYEFYMRKHNPPILYDSVTNVPSRAARVRNFNDFAEDIGASALPQWL